MPRPATPASTSSSRSSPALPRVPTWPRSSTSRGPATRAPRSGSSATSAACAAWARATGRASTPPRSGCMRTTPRRSPGTSPSSPGSAASRTSPRYSTASSTATAWKRKATAASSSRTSARQGVKRRRSDSEFQAAKERKRQVEAQLARAALDRYESDESFRFLYDRVAEMFAEMLKSDVEHLRAGDTAKIGLAAKWCPSLRSSYDRATLLCEAIARCIFPRESSQEYLNISDKHYAYRIRDRLRREVLVPLRKALELPEVYMCACKFEELPYARVASVAMRKYKEVFQKHDKHRVTSFFDEVRTGHARMPADGVLPHELIAAALKGEHDEAAELQWRRMAASLAAEGRLANCIAVCGLSGAAAAVADQPASAAVALGLLISELSQEPWKGRVITFDETHQLHKVRGANLKEKLRPLVAAMGAHRKGANLQGVFSKILQLAVAGGLRKDMMVKRVFVLSDMDFDGWTGAASVWKTEYQGICDKFAAEGFAAEGFTVPQVVFWNVGTSKASMPVVAEQEGAALVSGYSKNLVRLFLEADGELTPAAIVADAISGPEYDALEVFD
ncbi:hypothetical protein PVAP13_5NG012551 [Panicum virgatum]|uniref:Uncharacterized protein n=1 Tax=Panicum virgatum TaxID=38727 RepID=A0A8T0S8Z9_PANVG|nr:hypothetical protein PVAP13_5NG012551 [Panicum virgatum]